MDHRRSSEIDRIGNREAVRGVGGRGEKKPWDCCQPYVCIRLFQSLVVKLVISGARPTLFDLGVAIDKGGIRSRQRFFLFFMVGIDMFSRKDMTGWVINWQKLFIYCEEVKIALPLPSHFPQLFFIYTQNSTTVDFYNIL